MVFRDILRLFLRRGTVVRHRSCISDREPHPLCQLQCATCTIWHLEFVFNVAGDNLCSPRTAQKTASGRISAKISL